ncbi:hypothetical protein [Jannaschia sp. CCS1]|uniref:hypothetical protein n=1 Tax=Jannaschia sp. (strain CCS1) TaxID=290400 RepID=UPI000053D991|nr:hypothetical protein [Jannaschia sp. CCS1]ABD55936.1 hypothetical protein Jann_3019 [Jannaschia sp. CCS1]
MIRTAVFSGLLGLVSLPAACQPEPVDLGVLCEATVEETRAYAWALAYGVDLPLGNAADVYPVTEQDFFGVRVPDPEGLGLVAVNDAGVLFFGSCEGLLCTRQDAVAVFGQCQDTAGCALIGTTKFETFFPFYTSDRNGSHICDQE